MGSPTEPVYLRVLDDLRSKITSGSLEPGARVPSRNAIEGDPTGCGDVWGATYFSRLLAGESIADAMRVALVAAARNVDHRGATGLARHLRGELSIK